MKIKGIIPKFNRMIENRKYEREQKFLNKYVNIGSTINHDTYNQIYTARKGIANYLHDKGMTVEIQDARTLLGEHDSPVLENELRGKLNVVVTDMLTSQSESKCMNGDVKDNMLRNLYKNIENMVSAINNRK